MYNTQTTQITKRQNVTLWTIQAILAALFLFAGGMKLVLPAAMLTGPVAVPVAFLRFIGVAEACGALGLVLPGIFGIRRNLTPLAAVGLVTIMAGATTVTLEGGQIAGSLVPLVVGLLAVSIAYGRREWFRTRVSIPQPVARRLGRAA